MKKHLIVLLASIAIILCFATSAMAASTDLGNTPVQLDICDGSISIVSTAETVTYTQGDNVYTSTGGCVVTQSDVSPTSNRIDISSGYYEDSLIVKLTIASLNIESTLSPIALSRYANVSLSLTGISTISCISEDEDTRSIHAGISVATYTKLTIQGSGSLCVCGDTYGAGIGGGHDKADGGTIIINSGVVSATGGQWGAGIGGGARGSGGVITINGGTITATGGTYGAGIGGGGDGEGGTITITGGTITATGNESGAGIGSGAYASYHSNGGSVTISGGTIVSKSGGYEAAGVGGGTYSCGGSVFVDNANVTITGNYRAIGGGSGANEYGCDSIYIGKNATIICTKGSVYQERIDIEKQPLDSAAHSGNYATFELEAYGYSGITYQWQIKNKNDWSNTNNTSSSAAFSVTKETSGSSYRCKITNAYGGYVYSDVVHSYILSFTQQPKNVAIDLNEIAILEVSVSCSNVAYQWQRSYDGVGWINMDKQISDTLVLTTTLNENGAYYRCIITAANGDQLISEPAQIIVNSELDSYTTDFYLEQADGSYILTDRIVTGAEIGTPVLAVKKTYEHYIENVNLGVYNGTVTDNIKLVLSRYYDRCEYTVSFKSNGGASVAPISAKHGATIELPENLSRYGYVFDGWYFDEELTEEAQFDVMPMENITVFAKWTAVGSDRDVEYRINGITILGEGYQEMDSIPLGSFYAQVSITNLKSETVDCLILATYNENGQMLNLYFLYADPQVGQTFMLGTRINNTNGEVKEIRAFMLPMLGGPMVPLANSVSTAD